MSLTDVNNTSKTFFDDPEEQRRWDVHCEIRKQVYDEMYDVFGWMYLKDSDFHEAINEEVDRRVNLHFEKEKQILQLLDEPIRSVPQHVPNDADLVHLVEIDVSSEKEGENVIEESKKDVVEEEEPACKKFHSRCMDEVL